MAGENDRGRSAVLALARYRARGGLDPSFGVHGRVKNAFSVNAAATGVVVQRNGRIVVAGLVGSLKSPARRIALVRYLPNGGLDRSFGHRGKVTTPLEAQTVGVVLTATLALEPHGKIVVAATKDLGISGPSGFGVARYNVDGSLDSSFGTGGQATAAFGTDAAIETAMTLDSRGRIVVAGYDFDVATYSLHGFALARFDRNGAVDTTFGSGGEATTVVGVASAAAAVTIARDGKILAAGSTRVDKSGQISHFALVRYDKTGMLDNTFGTSGVVTTSFTNFDGADGVAVESDGTIVAAGTTTTRYGSRDRFAMARYKSDGSLAKSFGTHGKLTTAFGRGDAQAHALLLVGAHRFLLVGEAQAPVGNSRFAIARYRE